MKLAPFCILTALSLVTSVTSMESHAQTLCHRKGAVKVASGKRCPKSYKALKISVNSIQGDTGVKGDKGDTGAPGVQGPRGDMGPTGPVGAKGDKGDIGATGATGTFKMKTLAALCKSKSAVVKASKLPFSSGYASASLYADCGEHEYIGAFYKRETSASGHILTSPGRFDDEIDNFVAPSFLQIQWYGIPEASKAYAQMTFFVTCCPLDPATGVASQPIFAGQYIE